MAARAIQGGLVGDLAMDNAISSAAMMKGIGKVAARRHLITPDVSQNAKAVAYFAGRISSRIVGAKCPIVMPSLRPAQKLTPSPSVST